MLSEDVKILEVILFVENRPLSVDVLKRMSKLKEENILHALNAIQQEYDRDYHGIALETSEEGYVFAPKKSMYDSLKKTYGKKVDSRLTRAAVETLSIIAYEQPITRHEVDAIRGVSSDNIIRLLRERGFIKVTGRAQTIGNPCLYSTTQKFLHEFNLSTISDLPRLSEDDSIKYEEKNEEGEVLKGRLIKKRLKEEGYSIQPKKDNQNALDASTNQVVNQTDIASSPRTEINQEESEEVISFDSDDEVDAGQKNTTDSTNENFSESLTEDVADESFGDSNSEE